MSGHERIGIFGGTFDPIHNVHLNAARAALEQAGLDRVLFVVSARPPHKKDDTAAPPEQRLAMVRLATAGEPRFEVSDIEFHRDGPSYMYETLEALVGLHPSAEMLLIIGDDSFAEFPSWKKPDAILAHARLLVLPRPGKTRAAPSSMQGKFDYLPFQESDMSSTEIRKRIEAGESVAGLVPESVERYIQESGLYRGEDEFDLPRAREFVALLRERLPEKTYKHSLSVARTMLNAASAAGIAPEQAVTAGLLHDLCKAMKPEALAEKARGYGITHYLDVPNLLHGPVAAEECRRELGIHDEQIIDAIRWHTTGRADYGRVGQVLFFADFSEPRRPHPQAEEARRILTDRGFDAALRYVVAEKFHHVKKKYAPDPNSQAFEAWVNSRTPA
jgi:nicotinate-nucleotide adenylyltransferase